MSKIHRHRPARLYRSVTAYDLLPLPYLCESSDFFSFGTNDLTQMTYGLSRDHAEELFSRDYIDQRIFPPDPFQILGREGARLAAAQAELGVR